MTILVSFLFLNHAIFIYYTFIQGVTGGMCETWESVPYVKLYRYNPKHLYPKLNGYRDNGRRSLKLWQLLLTYWLPNTYWNWQEYVVSVMLIAVRNIKLNCELHKAIKLNYKNTRTRVIVVLRLPRLHAGRGWSVILWRQFYRMLSALPCLARACALDKYDVTDSVQYVNTPRSPYISTAIISVTVQLWI